MMNAAYPEIILRSELAAPFEIQCLVIEEDTAMVLSADTKVRVYDEHPIRLMTSLLDHKPATPGTIVIRGKSPYCFYAIVHDFDQDPSFSASWVTAALDKVLQKCAETDIKNLAMQMLGATHGVHDERWFIDFLRHYLEGKFEGKLIQNPQKILLLD